MKDLFGKSTVEGKPLSLIRENEGKQLCKIDRYNFDCEKCTAECTEVDVGPEPSHIPINSGKETK